MNPIQMYLRGLRIALSNWGLVWLCYGGTLLLTGLAGLSFLPLGILWVSGALLSGGWPLWVGVGLLVCAWLSVLLYGWFYLEGGLRGLVARAHRAGLPEEASRLTARPERAFRVLAIREFWKASKQNGGRVTTVATVYAGLGCVALLPLFAPLLWMMHLANAGTPGTPFFLLLALVLLMMAAVAFLLLALSLHYQTAVTLAIQRQWGWRESWRGATACIKARPLEFFGVFGMQLLFGMALGMVAFVVQLPFDLLLMNPGGWKALLGIRAVLLLLQMVPQSLLTVAAMGAYAAFCEPAASEPPPAATVAQEPSSA